MRMDEIKKLQKEFPQNGKKLASLIAEEILSQITPKEEKDLKDIEKGIERALNNDATMDLEKYIGIIVGLIKKGAFRP